MKRRSPPLSITTTTKWNQHPPFIYSVTTPSPDEGLEQEGQQRWGRNRNTSRMKSKKWETRGRVKKREENEWSQKRRRTQSPVLSHATEERQRLLGNTSKSTKSGGSEKTNGEKVTSRVKMFFIQIDVCSKLIWQLLNKRTDDLIKRTHI